MSVETIVVEGVGPYGPMAGGKWFGISKKAKCSIEDFRKGNSYTVDVWTADSGKKYINNIVAADPQASLDEHEIYSSGAPTVKAIKPATEIGKYFSGGTNSPEIQERIVRNTAYQKATDAISRLLTPYLIREEDIVSKLQANIEPLAQWIIARIKNAPVVQELAEVGA